MQIFLVGVLGNNHSTDDKVILALDKLDIMIFESLQMKVHCNLPVQDVSNRIIKTVAEEMVAIDPEMAVGSWRVMLAVVAAADVTGFLRCDAIFHKPLWSQILNT